MSLCLLCPGQGSQTTDMLARLAEDPLCRTSLRTLSAAVPPDTLAHAGDPAQCFLNRHAQALIVLFGLTVVDALRHADIAPALATGYSVGELTAHAAAGMLTPEDTLVLAGHRAQEMDGASPPEHGMLAVRGVPLSLLQQHADKAGAVIAIINGPDHAVLAGPADALDAVETMLSGSHAAHRVRLPITVPAHSHWLADAVPGFRNALATVNWQGVESPVLSGLDGKPVYRPAHAIDRLARQLAEPLDWARTLDIAIEMGTTVFFEVGPGCGLTRMVRERFPDMQARSLAEFGRTQGAIDWLRKHLHQ